MTYTINYLFSKIINGQIKNLEFIELNLKRISLKTSIIVLRLLLLEGYIHSYIINDNKTIKINLKYFKSLPLINKCVLLSKPKLRKYYSLIQIKQFYIKRGYHILLVISTSKGIMSGENALRLKIGGEPLFFLI